jgi:hypothetical protein
VPTAALVTTATLTLAVSVWAARRSDGLEVLVSIVDVGALAAFTLLHASVIGYFAVHRRGETRTAHRIVPVVGAGVTLWVIAGASSTAQITGAVWLAIGVIVIALSPATASSRSGTS